MQLLEKQSILSCFCILMFLNIWDCFSLFGVVELSIVLQVVIPLLYLVLKAFGKFMD